jgi:hypothetical protein
MTRLFLGILYPSTCNYSRASCLIGLCGPLFDGSLPLGNTAIVFEYLAVLRYLAPINIRRLDIFLGVRAHV